MKYRYAIIDGLGMECIEEYFDDLKEACQKCYELRLRRYAGDHDLVKAAEYAKNPTEVGFKVVKISDQLY